MNIMRGLKITATLALAMTTVVSFQNCSNSSQFEALASGASLDSSSKSLSDGDSSAAAETFCQKIYRVPVSFSDKSEGDGQSLTRFVQTVSNAPADLRACTTLAENPTGCTKDSEFVYLRDAWGANSYNASTRTFTFNQDVSGQGFPFKQYISRYKFADNKCYDELMDFAFSPTKNTVTLPIAVPRLQWVRTTSQACIGPTPSPAPIGQNCSVQGQTASNACGTATCLYK